METLSKVFLTPEFSSFLSYKLPYSLIILWLFYSIMVSSSKFLRKRISNYYVFESIPGVFVTLGLLGTFLGITSGLIHFNTDPELIKVSIQGLLEGLKNAFLTSILGIILSLIFSKIIKFKIGLGSVKEPISQESELLQTIDQTLNKMIDQGHQNNELQKTNLNEILKKLEGNSTAIRKKIDEFAENLAKNNSEALISAMKTVIEDFNDTFKKFIGELVNKNFEKLTESIDQLNSWQKEYKEQIVQTYKIYYNLVKKHGLFVENTQQWIDQMNEITNENSKIRELIKKLESVMVDDPRFCQIIDQIKNSSEGLNNATKSFENISNKVEIVTHAFESTEDKVSTWLDRENGIHESVLTLNNALNELRSFEVSSIENLDKSFNNRLATTFENLDKLIKEYITYIENRTDYENKAA